MYDVKFKMMRKFDIKSVVACLVGALLLMFTSCSSDDYINVIPNNSIALAAVDIQSLLENDKGNCAKKFLGLDDFRDSGLDLSTKLYFFETVDGNIGMAAKAADTDKLVDWFDGMSKKGVCKPVTKFKDYKFTVIKDSWVAGFSDDVLVILGPVLPVQQLEIRQNIVRLLGQDVENGIKGTPMFDHLDSIKAPVAFVAQAMALPDKFVAPFTLCAPKDADLSQVMVAAELDNTVGDEIIIHGETFSFNSKIDAEIKHTHDILRPIKGKYLSSVSSESAAGVFLNVEGEQFIKILHSNKTFQAVLTGMNTVIDMDNIIKSIDGDFIIVLPRIVNDMPEMQMCAQLKSKAFFNDIDYWKQSCPSGSKILNWGKDSYYYTSGDLTYYFGVSGDMQFYSGTTETEAKSILSKSAEPLSIDMQNLIKGQRMAMFFNLSTLLGQEGLGSMLHSLLGDKNTVLYIMK